MSIPTRSLCLLSLVLGSLTACGSGGGSGSSGGGANASELHLERLSAVPNSTWQINRAIELEFSLPIDFASVSANTIQIRSTTGVPATGTFAFRQSDPDGDGVLETDPRTVVFQPSCPTQDDFSDAGLAPGGTQYVLTVLGQDAGTDNTIRSLDGRTLEETQESRFRTPQSRNDIGTIFLDEVPGPPIPLLRTRDSAVQEGVSYIELGRDPDPSTRIYYEFDEVTQSFSIDPGSRAPDEVPLNLYADEAARAAVLLEFNQAVNPSAVNISERRLRLEYETSTDDWVPIDTRVELIANCTATGATLRLQPLGLLPRASRFRVAVLEGFQDIVGSPVQSRLDQFGVAPTEVLGFSSLNDPSAGADEFLESFDVGGGGIDSFEDTDVLFDTPLAEWKDGRLTAAFDFEGTGGPRGDFDWIVDPGEIFVFDTNTSSIVGGPGGVPTVSQNTVGGVVNVRNLIVREGGLLRVQGVNSMLLNATGYVRIEGTIDASGFNAKNVATLDSGRQPETGGTGAAGGGEGGAASTSVNSSTKTGGTGGGPFLERGTGGLGGESGYNNNNNPDFRRPGGGGGGRFAADAEVPADPLDLSSGLWAQRGYPGHANSRGACTKRRPAMGGLPGKGPFQDTTTENDFFGVRPIVRPDQQGGFELEELIQGELTSTWAGYGGGGGGDALPSASFPTPRWDASSDEKGGGGGGGGGGIRIRALGEIVFGPRGLIESEGGRGGAGENTSWLDHIAGTGGSGSGGHVILESATRIDFTNGDPETRNAIHIRVRGGSTTRGPLSDENNEIPENVSYGGSGGPGLIQLHVPSIHPPSNVLANTNLFVSNQAATNPEPLRAYTLPLGYQLIPTFGARSKVRSRWISVGGATLDSMAGPNLVEFLFDGVEKAPGPDQGKLLGGRGKTSELAPILGPAAFPSPAVDVLEDDVTLRLEGAALDPLIQSTAPISKDLYLRTPTLFRHFLLRVNQVGNPGNHFDFDVVAASYDDVDRVLELTVRAVGETIDSALEALGGLAEYSVIPRFLRTRTNGVADALPDDAFVRITFDAARDDGFGNPDEASLLVEQTGNIADFNALAPGELQFFRFQVEFNLDAAGAGVEASTKPVALEFLRIPFRF